MRYCSVHKMRERYSRRSRRREVSWTREPRSSQVWRWQPGELLIKHRVMILPASRGVVVVGVVVGMMVVVVVVVVVVVFIVVLFVVVEMNTSDISDYRQG